MRLNSRGLAITALGGLSYSVCMRVAIAAMAVAGCALAAQAPANSYVDPAVCAQCHGQIAANYRKTGMGRSFYRPAPDPTAKPFYHAASETYFAMVERGGKYYQRRWQIAFDGKETNVDE